MNSGDMLSYALAAQAKGWRIFPIAEGTKDRPRYKAWGRTASSDIEKITKWWTKWPADNIGIACGPSNLCVVDVDVKGKKRGDIELDVLEVGHGPLPPTFEVVTPSGGRHLYFFGSAKTTVDKLAKGIDTRSASSSPEGQGGYVLADGSRLANGSYEALDPGATVMPVPDWIREAAGKPREREGPRIDEPEGGWDAPSDIERAKGFLRDEPAAEEGEGSDDQTYRMTCRLRDLALSKETVLQLLGEWSPHDPDWLTSKVDHAFEYAAGNAGEDSAITDFPEDLPGNYKEDSSGGDGDGDDERIADPRYRGLGDEWVWVVQSKVFVRRADRFKLDREAFDTMFNYMTEGPSISREFFKAKKSMRKPECFCYRPGQEELPEGGTLYNLWTPSAVEPKKGGAPWLLEHCAYLMPNEKDRDLLLDWMAHLIQKPDEKLAFALLLHGIEGTGKSWLGHLMEAIIGTANTVRPSNAELHSTFNAWAAGAQLCVIEELMATGRRDLANRLKPLITDPFVRVEEKYRSPYTIENHMAFMMFTNWEDAIPIDRGDRRYMVLMSPAQPRPPGYYEELFGHLAGDGPALAAGELWRRDITGFKGRGRAPETLGKEKMRRATMGEVERELLEFMELGLPPFSGDLVCVQDLVDALPQRMQKIPKLSNLCGRFLRDEAKAVEQGQSDTFTGRKRLWSLRRHELLQALSPKDRGARYDRAKLAFELNDSMEDPLG